MKKAPLTSQGSVRDARSRKKGQGEVVDLSILHEGCYFLKFGRKGIAHERLIRLSPDNRFVEWETSFFTFKAKEECSVSLESVTRIQHGQMTASFERQKEQFGSAHGNSFSLIYGNDRSLDLIAPSPEVFRLWFVGLRQLLTDIKTEKMSTSNDKRFLKAKWDIADADGNGSLSKHEVVDLIVAMNINRPKKTIHAMYKKFDTDNSGTLSFKEFCALMDILRQRDDLLFLWCTIALEHPPEDLLDLTIDPDVLTSRYGKQVLTPDDTIPLSTFLEFWLKNQKQKLTLDKAMKIIAANMEEFDKKNPVLSYHGFCSIMTSSLNDGFAEKKQRLHQDMGLPLSFYYMASSHNTYLEGDQLTSSSSVNRYIDDLCKGCRCVELDCWDGDDGEPIIFHGHTLTTKILFRDVINAMAEFNFRVTPYPVVLSIENHCSLPQQELMAEIIKIGFGDSLLMPGELMGSGSHLPTLEQLKYKVLIKGKRLKVGEDLLDDDSDDSGDDSDDDSDDDDDDLAKGKMSKKKKSPALKVHPSLSAIVFLGTCHCTSFVQAASDAIAPDMMTSYGESKTVKYLKNNATREGWIYHNRTHLSRIYPKGTRVDSSNLDPCPAWAAGNQLVALNYQTPCVQMHLNHSKFRENGECGYVLKPQYMYLAAATPSPPVMLRVHLVSGQMLPKPGGAKKGEVIDPYVSLAVYGGTAVVKEPPYQHSTVVENNGFNPAWDEMFEFEIPDPDVAQLYMKVMDSDLNNDDFVAYSSTPVAALLPGYRSFKLFDEKGTADGDFQFASLFARITFQSISNNI